MEGRSGGEEWEVGCWRSRGEGGGERREKEGRKEIGMEL